MITKICSGCHKSQNIDQFNWKVKANNTRMSKCKTCTQLYANTHYQHNKSYYLERNRKRRKLFLETNIRRVIKYYRDHPCVDCGEIDPVVLEFDHVRGKKQFTIGRKLAELSWREIRKEISKCEVRCACCHRRKTAKNGKWMTWLLSN